MSQAVSPDLAILLPGMLMIIYTLLFYFYLGWQRRAAVLRGEVDPRYFKTYSGKPLPERLVLLGRHADNLIEMPPVFYVLLLFQYVSDHVTEFTLALAWVFLGTRALHAYFHLGSNKVLHRFQAFACSMVILLVMAVDLAWHVFQQAT